MTAEEAKTKLESWRDLLKAKLEWTTEGPWRFDRRIGCVAVYAGPEINCLENEKDNLIHYSSKGVESDKSRGSWSMPHSTSADAELFAFSRSAVPAMLAGIEKALWHHREINKQRPDTESGDSWMACSDAYIKLVAKAYEPYFQEVQS